MISGKGRFGYVTDTWLYFTALRDTGTDAYYDLDVVRMKIDGSEEATLPHWTESTFLLSTKAGSISF